MYQITNTNIRHGYVWANQECSFVSVPKTANMQFRKICGRYKMKYKHQDEVLDPAFQFCVVRNPWTRVLSGLGEYRRRRLRHDKKLTWRTLCERLLESPTQFDEHLEPQIAFMQGYTFTHIFKFENMLDDALNFPYFKNDPGWIKSNINPVRSQRSQHLDLVEIQKDNQDLLDQIVAKYYSRDYEIWLRPAMFVNKPVR